MLFCKEKGLFCNPELSDLVVNEKLMKDDNSNLEGRHKTVRFSKSYRRYKVVRFFSRPIPSTSTHINNYIQKVLEAGVPQFLN